MELCLRRVGHLRRDDLRRRGLLGLRICKSRRSLHRQRQVLRLLDRREISQSGMAKLTKKQFAAASLLAGLATSAASCPAGPADWPMFGQNVSNTAEGHEET